MTVPKLHSNQTVTWKMIKKLTKKLDKNYDKIHKIEKENNAINDQLHKQYLRLSKE